MRFAMPKARNDIRVIAALAGIALLCACGLVMGEPPTARIGVLGEGSRRILVVEVPVATESDDYDPPSGIARWATLHHMPTWTTLDADPYGARKAGGAVDAMALDLASVAGWQPRVQVASADRVLLPPTHPPRGSWVAAMVDRAVTGGRLGWFGKRIAMACISSGPCDLPRDDLDAQADAAARAVAGSKGDALVIGAPGLAEAMVPVLRGKLRAGMWTAGWGTMDH